jgi:hypothetical protein
MAGLVPAMTKNKMAPSTRCTLFPDPIFKQPGFQTSLDALAAEIPREPGPDFRWPLRHERLLLRSPSNRGSGAPYGAGVETVRIRHGDRPRPLPRTASPQGAPLRRFLGSRLDLGAPLALLAPSAFAAGEPEEVRNEPWASVLRREAPPRPPGIMVANHDRRRRSPSTLSTPAEHPSGERGWVRDSIPEISVNINFTIAAMPREGGASSC